jgi:hypothetical protein
MSWRTRMAALLSVIVSLIPVSGVAQTLYAATGSSGVTGNLYTVSTVTAAATVVGPILLGATPLAMTGLAVHPTTGVLYGITANSDPTIPRHLVIISATSGAATDVGAMGTGGADIAFNAGGTLYMTSGNNGNLWTVNLTTGLATAVGATSFGSVSGGGLGINAGGGAFFSPNGANGTIATVNLATGAATAGPTLAGAPIPGGTINAASFSAGGVLFAVNGNFGGGPDNLVTIDTATGAVTNIGALPTNIDAIAFGAGGASSSGIPTLGQWALFAMALMLFMTGSLVARRKR